MTKDNLLLLFRRPREPTFFPKDEGKIIFELPDNFLTERYKPIGTELQSRFGIEAETRIPVQSITLPDIDFAKELRRNGPFSLFIDKHRQIAGDLIQLLMNAADVSSLMSTAVYCRDRLNPYLFQYAYTVALQHRPDTQDLSVPSYVQQFPDQFIDPEVFPQLREETSIVGSSNRINVEIPRFYTANEREQEQRLAHFREDIGINMHHWHWHLVYPGIGPDEVVRKDRRGELFYYMHNQMLARYDVERYCARLPRVKPLENFREPIPEAYFPKIIRSSNNKAYPPRLSNTVLRDINREDDNNIVKISELERWRDRILEAIDQGFVTSLRPAAGTSYPLDEQNGLEILANLVEASQLSINRALYGNIHNMGHNVISYIHDPDGRHLEDYGVMGDVATAMRDPIFYRWHKFIDTIFQRFKARLQSYNENQLKFENISISSLSMHISRGNPTPNVLLTYWQKSQVDLSAGLDFSPEGNAFVSFTHLQHAPFIYKLAVMNESGGIKKGTCRIFICPKYNEHETLLELKDQRTLMIEMDKFTVVLNPGENSIVRRSDESSVTVPYERTFRSIGTESMPTNPNELEKFQFCGCGWPDHMLVPKGTKESTECFLFAMISKYEDDVVEEVSSSQCSDSHSYCGLRDKKYPDKRAMGFPFDRPHPSTNLETFVAPYSNMMCTEFRIRFVDTIVAKV